MLIQYLKQRMKKACYEFDKETKAWCAWMPELPGVYAQADTKEEVKKQLKEVMEDYKQNNPDLQSCLVSGPMGT